MLNIDKLEGFAKLRKEIQGQEEYIRSLKAKRDEMQEEIKQEMHKSKLKSLKSEDATYSLMNKKTFKVADERKLMDELRKRKLDYGTIVEKIDSRELNNVANQIMKETGEILPFTELSETEYLSIRAAK